MFYLQGSVLAKPTLKHGKNNSFTSIKLKVGNQSALYFFPYAFGKIAEKATELNKGDEVFLALTTQIRQQEILLVITSLTLIKRAVNDNVVPLNKQTQMPQTQTQQRQTQAPQSQTQTQQRQTQAPQSQTETSQFNMPQSAPMPQDDNYPNTNYQPAPQRQPAPQAAPMPQPADASFPSDNDVPPEPNDQMMPPAQDIPPKKTGVYANIRDKRNLAQKQMQAEKTKETRQSAHEQSVAKTIFDKFLGTSDK